MAKNDKIQVKVISRHGNSLLVEWLDGNLLQRGYVPEQVVLEEGWTPKSEVEAAIPYGVPWSDIITLSATPEALEQRLRQVGIWTKEDLLQKPQAVIGALQAVYRIDFSALKRLAERYDNKEI